MGMNDNSFSQQLVLHASSLDLSLRTAVGPWTFGQSIRRATDKMFFYDLSLRYFYPLGLNHPLFLQSPSNDSSPQSFAPELLKHLPHLESLRWIVLSEERYQALKGSFTVDETQQIFIDSIWGWGILEQPTENLFSVPLADKSFWVCGRNLSIESDNLIHHRWLHLFLSPYVLGAQGRISVVKNMLQDIFQLPELAGLKMITPLNTQTLQSLGIDAEFVSASESALYFPVSVLRSDLEQINLILRQARDSAC